MRVKTNPEWMIKMRLADGRIVEVPGRFTESGTCAAILGPEMLALPKIRRARVDYDKNGIGWTRQARAALLNTDVD